MKINHKIKREKVRRCLDYDNSNPVPNVGAVKSCQLQSIFHFYNNDFLTLCPKFTNTKNQLVLQVKKHFVVNKSSCRSLQNALKEKSICNSFTN